MPSDPNSLLDSPPIKTSPVDFAMRVGQYVRALILLLMWTVLAFAGLGLGYLSIRGVVFLVKMASEGLGI